MKWKDKVVAFNSFLFPDRLKTTSLSWSGAPPSLQSCWYDDGCGDDSGDDDDGGDDGGGDDGGDDDGGGDGGGDGGVDHDSYDGDDGDGSEDVLSASWALKSQYLTIPKISVNISIPV